MQADEPLASFVPYDALPERSSARSSRIPLLLLVFAVGLLLFLAIEPTKPWILLVLTGLVAVGTDGVLREHPHAAYEVDTAWTAPLLFLPTLLALGGGLFLEDVLEGYWVVPGSVVLTLLMAAVLYAEHVSIDAAADAYPAARFALNMGTYLTAFAFYAVVYTFDVSLLPAALAVGLVSFLLAVEIVREAEADPLHALAFAALVGLIIAEARMALYFLPLESYLAGVFLLICFYLTSGIVQHHLNDDLRRPVLGEFIGIAAAGVFIVTLGRLFESGR